MSNKIYNIFRITYDKLYHGDTYESCDLLFSTLDEKKANEFVKQYNKKMKEKEPVENQNFEIDIKESELDTETYIDLHSCQTA